MDTFTHKEFTLGSGRFHLPQTLQLEGGSSTYAQLLTQNMAGTLSGTTYAGATPVPGCVVRLMFADQMRPLLSTRSNASAQYSFQYLDATRSDYVVIAAPPHDLSPLRNLAVFWKLTPST
jgi:hypothetical protein